MNCIMLGLNSIYLSTLSVVLGTKEPPLLFSEYVCRYLHKVLQGSTIIILLKSAKYLYFLKKLMALIL